MLKFLSARVAFVGHQILLWYDYFHTNEHMQFSLIPLNHIKSGDYIIAGKNFGTGDYLTVYNEAI